ncbi:MAG: ribonuclease H-like domain-containing protein, partial [Candidatus Micrarchaeota archaeon]|nr:ribonuclease H-like domain-containing protein [Candidatus Micrarchaeota archaeon]
IRRDGKKQMLKLIHTLMSEADAIVHYNGNKFDVPTLNQECLAIGLTPPTPTHQIDLYQTAKRRFRFASNKLDYVAGELGLGHKTPHKGMELWRGCMAGNPDDWALMERYNKQDVRLLERVYTKMLPWIPNHPNHGNFANRADTCPNCGGHRLKSYGIRYAQTRAYQRLLCLDCGAWARSP